MLRHVCSIRCVFAFMRSIVGGNVAGVCCREAYGHTTAATEVFCHSEKKDTTGSSNHRYTHRRQQPPSLLADLMNQVDASVVVLVAAELCRLLDRFLREWPSENRATFGSRFDRRFSATVALTRFSAAILVYSSGIAYQQL